MEKIYTSRTVLGSVFKLLLLGLLMFPYSFAHGQTIIWQEDFNDDNGCVGNGSPKLGCDYDWWTGLRNPDIMESNSGKLYCSGSPGDVWETCGIPISGYNDVTVSIHIGRGPLYYTGDQLRIDYEIDGMSDPDQSWILSGPFESPQTPVRSGLRGNTLKLRVSMRVSGAWIFQGYYWIDNVVVSGTCIPITAYNVRGIGANCTGGDGVEIIMDGSQPGIYYQLYKRQLPWDQWIGNPVFGTGSSISFGKHTIAGSYRISAYNNSLAECNAYMKGNVVISESSPPPDAVYVTGDGTFCGPTDINATGGSGGTIYFQETTSGGTSSDIPASYETIGASGTYYFRAISPAGCWGPEGSAKVIISPSEGGTATSEISSLCSGNSTSLTVNGYRGFIQWQQSEDGSSNWINVIGGDGGTTETYKTPNLTTTRYYRALVQSGDCQEDYSNTVGVMVYPLSVGGTVTGNQTICPGSTPSGLTLSGNIGNIIKWQKSTVDDFTSAIDIPETNTTLSGSTIGSLTSTTYVRALVQSGVCDLAYSSTGTIIVDPLPEAPIAGNVATTYDGKIHIGTATPPSDSRVVWYDAFNTDNTTNAPSGTNVGTYTAWAESINGIGCKSASRTKVVVTISPAPLTIKANDATKYCGQVNPVFSVAYVGFVNGENKSVLGGTLSINSTANEDSGIGTYSITPSGLTSSNYEIKFMPGVLIINGVSLDAYASSKPVLIGAPGITLSAKVLNLSSVPVPGVKVWFSIENGNNQITNYPAVFTDGSGVATLTIIGLASMADELKVTAVAGSGCGNAATSIAYISVYNPNGGFVTGGGWINSPPGAYYANKALTGIVNFGFVSKYKKGSNVPDGNCEFQFHDGNLNFRSSSNDLGSLVIAGYRAIFKGVGTINGTGSYGFMVSAVDGDIVGGGGYDKFRIKIWNKTDGAIVYDNNPGKDENDIPLTNLGGGSIVIHKAEDNTTKSIQTPGINEPLQMAELGVKAYPNPFNDHLYFDLQLKTDSKVRLEIFDINGSKLATVYDDIVVAFNRYWIEYVPINVSSGLLFYRLTLNGQVFIGKVVYQK